MEDSGSVYEEEFETKIDRVEEISRGKEEKRSKDDRVRIQ